MDVNKIQEFFPLETTLHGMLRIFERLFGLNFSEIVSDPAAELVGLQGENDAVWHKDVKIFQVSNDEDLGGEFEGHSYMDLYARANKYNNVACFSLIPVCGMSP